MNGNVELVLTRTDLGKKKNEKGTFIGLRIPADKASNNFSYLDVRA